MDALTDIENYLLLKANSQRVINSILKFVFPEGVIVIDGTNGNYTTHQNSINNENCAIYLDTTTFYKIKDKKINPIIAYTLKKIKVKGDINLALKVVGFI